jgi:hypothetical protein
MPLAPLRTRDRTALGGDRKKTVGFESQKSYGEARPED